MTKFDEEFRRTYRDARDEQSGHVPNFGRLTEPRPDPPRWIPAFAIAALATAVTLFVVTFDTPSDDVEPKEIVEIVETFELDETAIVLSTEEWEAPTDFLLVDPFEEQTGSMFDGLDNLEELKEL